MINYLAMIQANKLNLFPVKGGVSKYYSSRMILNQTNLDYTKHYVVPFGAYVQANHESTKTSSNVTRTLDAIYLRPAQNQQGGYELMDLNSGQLISRNIVHKIPVTHVVIKAVENMAYQQGFKSLSSRTETASSIMMLIRLQEWIMMIPMTSKMKMKNTNSNNMKNSRNNSKTSILKRSKTS
jgi:hypothetical protein